jgi:hypothetical protein
MRGVMTTSVQTISIRPDHILVERPADYEVVLSEQSKDLLELSAASNETGCKKVLVVGPRTKVRLSPFDMLELGKRIAKLDLQMAIVEIHDASNDAMSLLKSVALNRGSRIRFFDNVDDAKRWLEIA